LALLEIQEQKGSTLWNGVNSSMGFTEFVHTSIPALSAFHLARPKFSSSSLLSSLLNMQNSCLHLAQRMTSKYRNKHDYDHLNIKCSCFSKCVIITHSIEWQTYL
jgi:hypothetical protein